MRTVLLRAVAGVCLFASFLPAASSHPATPVYPQVICVVPMVGAGTLSDPRRPKFAPVAGQAAETGKRSKGFADPAAITSYRSVISDDGLSAIVIFEAHDRTAFQPILSDSSLLKSFNPATTPVDTLLAALRLFKKDFDLRMLQGGAL